jgi:mRNA interferase MazF
MGLTRLTQTTNPIILNHKLPTYMKEGSIILTSLPQSDGSYKLRPVLVLRELPTYNDFLVCGISTQLHQEIIDFDIVINANSVNGLKANSLVRLSFLAVLSPKDLKNTIGKIESATHNLLLQRLSNHLIK